jgi:drug/metabolite transporter (DMT)-like permease
MLNAPEIPHAILPWSIGLLVALLIVGNNLLMFKAFNILEASLLGAIIKIRLVWVFALSIIFLSTQFSWLKLAGTVCAILAGVVIIRNFKRPKHITGVAYALSASVFNALVIILYKNLLGHFSVGSLTFFVTFLLPVFINLLIIPNASSRIKRIMKSDGPMLLAACALGALANLALNKALSLGEATNVVVITEAFLILTLVGEHVVLKEREQSWVKLAAVALAIAGAVLITLSG